MKESHFNLTKNEPVCMCKESWGVRLRQEGGSLREGREIVWNILKEGGIEKRGVEKIKNGGLVSWVKGWLP